MPLQSQGCNCIVRSLLTGVQVQQAPDASTSADDADDDAAPSQDTDLIGACFYVRNARLCAGRYWCPRHRWHRRHLRPADADPALGGDLLVPDLPPAAEAPQ